MSDDRKNDAAAPNRERRAAEAVHAASRLPAPPVYEVIRRDGQEELERPWVSMVWSGLAAGILIAAVVCMLPSAGGSAFWIILIFTYLIALGEFTHVIAGSVEVLYLMVKGLADLEHAVFGFLVPVFSGNVIGGTAVFTLLAWGQVKREVPRDRGVVSYSRDDGDGDDGEGRRRSGYSP